MSHLFLDNTPSNSKLLCLKKKKKSHVLRKYIYAQDPLQVFDNLAKSTLV